MGICDTPALSAGGATNFQTARADAALITAVKKYAKVIPTADLADAAELTGIAEATFAPADVFLRCYHYLRADGSSVYMLVNEGTDIWKGTVTSLRKREPGERGFTDMTPGKTSVTRWILTGQPAPGETTLEPLQSRILIFDATAKAAEIRDSLTLRAIDRLASKSKEEIALAASLWKRSTCAGIDYPAFGEAKEIVLPDPLAEEEPEFSGFVRYENTFRADEALSAAGDKRLLLEITDAHEGVEVFVNDQSLGIQIVPTYCFDLTDALVPGENRIRIEAATTLERENYKIPHRMGLPKPDRRIPPASTAKYICI